MPQELSSTANQSVHGFTRGEIENRLTPGKDSEIAQAIAILLAQFPNIRDPGPEEAQLRMQGYVRGLRRFGLLTIKRCVDAVLSGDPAFNPRYMPLVPEMAAWCRLEEAFDRRRLAELAGAGGASEAICGPTSRPDQMQKLADVVKSLDVVIAEDKLILGRAVMPSIAKGKSDAECAGD